MCFEALCPDGNETLLLGKVTDKMGDSEKWISGYPATPKSNRPKIHKMTLTLEGNNQFSAVSDKLKVVLDYV